MQMGLRMDTSQPREPRTGPGPSATTIPFVESPRIDWKNGRPYATARLSSDYAMSLETLALAKEKDIKSLPVTPGWERAAETSPTTVRYSNYSAFLLSPETLPLFFAIRETYHHLLRELKQEPVPRFIQCWYNVHRCGASLLRHRHPYPFIGTFSAHSEGSATRYGNTKEPSRSDVIIKHQIGQLLVTTGEDHYHDTSTWNETDRARVTYAFDIVNFDQWNQQQMFLPFDA